MKLLKRSKTDAGHVLTRSLFYETCYDNLREAYCVFTLKEEDIKVDGNKYLSLKRIFLSYDDPTEYDFAKDVFGSLLHWKNICKCKWFKEHIEDWREEQEVKLKSVAIKQIAGQALSEKGFSASRWIAEGSWKPKKIGALSKKEKESKDRVAKSLDYSVSKDLERLKLVN